MTAPVSTVPAAIARQVCPPGRGRPHLKKATEATFPIATTGNFAGLAVGAIGIATNEKLWFLTVEAPALTGAVVIFEGGIFATVDAGTVLTIDGSSLPDYAFAGEQVQIANPQRALIFWGPPG